MGARLRSVEGSSFSLPVGPARGNHLDREEFTTVDLTKTAYRDDPFVLTKDVMQIFYARDNKTKAKLKVVLEGKMKIVGVDGVTDKKDYRSYQEMPPFGANVPLPIL